MKKSIVLFLHFIFPIEVFYIILYMLYIKVTINPPQIHQNLHRTRETGYWRAQTESGAHQDPGERSSDPLKRLTQTCPWVSRSLSQKCGSAVACCRVRGTECGSACMRSFEGGRNYLHYLHHSLASGQITEREHSPTLQQKIRVQIYWERPGHSEQDPVSPSVSPIRKFP